MGLFDKKKKDDFDSPVEEVSLSKPAAPNPAAGAAKPQTAATPPASAAKAAEAPKPAASAAAGSTPAPAAASAAAKPAQKPAELDHDDINYGINRAIELMRDLGKDNIEIVVKVVKKTLESMHIKVASIIKDASRKQADIEGRVGVLKNEIAELEGEIATRKKEISGLEADHAETTDVKERLMLAEKMAAEKEAKEAAKDAAKPAGK
jgi:hypothetical protein